MHIDLSGEIICGQRLKKIVDFLFEISDRVDLVSSDYHEMTKEEYERAQIEREYIQRELHCANGFTEAELDDLIAEGDPEAIELCRRIKAAQENEAYDREHSFIKADEIAAIVEKKFKGLACIKRKVTCHTHCTIGGAVVVYSLPANEELKKLFTQMELLTWPLKTSEGVYLAEDPAFYKDGKEVCSICSHERYIHLKLTQEQVLQIEALDIPMNAEWEEQEKRKKEFPFLKEVIDIVAMESGVTTLLGRGLFNWEDDDFGDYLEFFSWFEEHQAVIRTRILPCKKSAKDIVEYLWQKYSLQEDYSEAIEHQCQWRAWNSLYVKPLEAKIIQSVSELEPFLFRINYMGEELIVGGEYKSDYLFIDTMGAENKLRKLLERLDEGVCAFTEQVSLSDPLFQLMKEINSYRGIDEYEIYDVMCFRTYLQTIWYDDIKTKKYRTCKDTGRG